ncbi:L-lactate permease [Staphylococcus saprophyticus]|jgi:lactate permease|uniref:L-lactate permease n=4 Tax=Staphylococcus TaxID=1279 RepID=Q49ZU2_STAS1|nr:MULTISPECIES: L-lactate permease [Staphylococcus]SIN57195.1 L-lactate transport [Mycobacteroides abscessus subsp. abscessus]AMG19614.1 L-lactate permease [Staphylococcus saprophyticus]AMG32719.1 L-lactate permease [Staphylococcus saprophyticus]ASE58656.1 L-lactate permease [Staphylococcus saprophyticus]ASF19627.1 L-lactate permease [Staphylococcus saprophyticus]
MFVDTFNPFDNVLLSSIVAAVPIVLFLLCLTIFKMKGIYASITTVVVTVIIAIVFFKLPVNIASGAVVEGFFQGIIPIGYIVVMAVLLYKITNETGQFDTIQDSISSISQDQRIQLLLIGFAFNGFLEGAAGFGVPIAICALLLTQLGFAPLQAAMLCLIANASAGAFGAIGLPVTVIDTLGLHDSVTGMAVSSMSALTLVLMNMLIPFLLIWIIDGFKGIKETLPAILVVAITFTVLQAIITVFIGPELADIIPPLGAMMALAIFSKKFQPKHIFRINKDEEPPKISKHQPKEIIYAWSPFVILTVVVMIWSASFFKALFVPGGALESFVFNIALPGTYSEIANKAITLPLNIIGQTGTAILIVIVITILMSNKVHFKDGVRLFKNAFKELWLPIITICFILVISKLMTYAGLSNAVGEGIAKTGSIFPLLSPILGWIGVFLTGSVTNNNTLFAPIQAAVASNIGASGALLVSANTVGGVAAKLISPQSIAIATASVQQVGKESELLKMTLRYSVALLVFVCIWTFLLNIFI